MNKKILTIEDLVNFFASSNLQRFSSSESGYQICAQMPSTYEIKESNNAFLFGKIKLLHTGRNRNRSNVTEDAARKCMDKIKYKPILANFCEVDGVKDFTSHDIEFTDDGVVYLEHQVGCFTVDDPYMEYDEEKKKNYMYATAAIPREYTAAAEIIERKGGTKVSVELLVNEMSYDAKEKELVLEDIEIMGCTLLGVNPDNSDPVEEGMEGARLDIQNYAVNSVQFERNDKLIETLEKLNTTLSKFNIDNAKKGGDNGLKFEELLKKYNKTLDDITFDYENLSDEELESEFRKAFEDDGSEGADGSDPDGGSDVTESGAGETDGGEDTETDSGGAGESEEGGEGSGGSEEDDEDGEDEDTSYSDTTVEVPNKRNTYSVKIEWNGKEFSRSLNEKIAALSELVNETYSDSDDDYYVCEVFEDEGYVNMFGVWSGKSYRQTYKVDGDKYTLTGDRVETFSRWLTQEEIDRLDSMSEKLSKYESEPEKLAILQSNEYGYVADTKEFAELSKNYFDMSVEDVRAKADEILLSYVKKCQFSADNKDKSNTSKKMFTKTNKKPGRYGNLFSN